jgi:hypothetical protein
MASLRSYHLSSATRIHQRAFLQLSTSSVALSRSQNNPLLTPSAYTQPQIPCPPHFDTPNISQIIVQFHMHNLTLPTRILKRHPSQFAARVGIACIVLDTYTHSAMDLKRKEVRYFSRTQKHPFLRRRTCFGRRYHNIYLIGAGRGRGGSRFLIRLCLG